MDDKIKSGFILIDKPRDWTSFDIVAKLRSITNIKKIGHAGTLDPIATGLLIIAIGREATKQIDKYMKMDKVYEVKAKLGEVSDSYDTESEARPIVNTNKYINEITKVKLQEVLNGFMGDIQQIPPMYSAKKVAGQRLYKLARQGKEIVRNPINITISDIKLLNFEYPWVDFKVSCSTGTYIRSLVDDIGQVLGCGAVMHELRRVQIGEFNINQAVDIDKINDNWQDLLLK